MSIKYINAVLESDIGPVHKRMVLISIADNCNDNGLCRPGIEHTVGKSQVARSTVFRIIDELERDGILQRRARRRPDGSRRSNAYKVNLEALQARKRIITKAEEDELEALFEDDYSGVASRETAGREHSPAAGRGAKDGGERAGQAQGPAAGRSTAHSPAAGPYGGPAAGPLEPSGTVKFPPSPPQSGGDGAPPATGSAPSGERCETHRRWRCRECGLSPRVQAREERDREAAEIEAAETTGRACRVCIPDGPRSDGKGTRWICALPGTQTPITPYRTCRHDKAHDQVLAEIEAEENAAEAARAAGGGVAAPTASETARAAARALFQSKRASAAVQVRPSRRGASVRVSPSAPVSTGTDGLDGSTGATLIDSAAVAS